MIDYTQYLNEIAKYVATYFKQYANPNLLYHNYDHTLRVVDRVKEIRTFYSLTEKDIFVLEAAAWFHDVGQLTGSSQNHEEVSVSVMQDYLNFEALGETALSIKQCILATKFPHETTSLLDEIICDADTYNLGTDEFANTDALLKREYELRGLPTNDWDRNTLSFLLQHKYFTDYCHENLQFGKAKNIELVRQRIFQL